MKTELLSREHAYEYNNILERWFLSMINDESRTLIKGFIDYYHSPVADEEFLRVMREKKIPGDHRKILQTVYEVIEKYIPTKVVDTPTREGNVVKYALFEVIIPSDIIEGHNAIEQFISRCGLSEFVYMMMRYKSLNLGSQHWTALRPNMTRIIEMTGKNQLECFSSGFNVVGSAVGDAQKGKNAGVDYCSPLKSKDKKNKGDFFRVDLSKYDELAANPPFIVTLMDRMINKILSELKGKVHILLPKWEDWNGLKKLRESKMFINEIILMPGDSVTVNLVTGEVVPMTRIGMVYITLRGSNTELKL